MATGETIAKLMLAAAVAGMVMFGAKAAHNTALPLD